MYKLLLRHNWDKRGGMLWNITRLLKEYYDIEFENYTDQKRGVYFGYDLLPPELEKKSKIRKIILVGGTRATDDGIAQKTAWKRINHVIFNSQFAANIALSAHRSINKWSIIHMVGGAPADPNMMKPLSGPKASFDKNNLHFMICAKWWKRPFKRKKQSIKLFTDYILPRYPGATMHVLGEKIKKNYQRGNVYYYDKNFHGDLIRETYEKSHMQIILTAFDTGPMLVNESMHYRVPFISSNNCASSEYVSLVDGMPGEVVKIDPTLKNARTCKKYKPTSNKKYYGTDVNYPVLFDAVVKILENYSEYVSWNWTDEFNYKTQAAKWMNVFFG